MLSPREILETTRYRRNERSPPRRLDASPLILPRSSPRCTPSAGDLHGAHPDASVDQFPRSSMYRSGLTARRSDDGHRAEDAELYRRDGITADRVLGPRLGLAPRVRRARAVPEVPVRPSVLTSRISTLEGRGPHLSYASPPNRPEGDRTEGEEQQGSHGRFVADSRPAPAARFHPSPRVAYAAQAADPKRWKAILQATVLETEVQNEEEPSFCCICVEDIAVGEEVRVLTCKHRYHRECIDEWLKKSILDPRCCICKRSVLHEEDMAEHDGVEAVAESTSAGWRWQLAASVWRPLRGVVGSRAPSPNLGDSGDPAHPEE